MEWQKQIFRHIILLLLVAVPASLTSSQRNLPKGVTLKDGDQYEYIVVGAGAAGSAAAARLALAGASVLLVEAGGDPDPLSWTPSVSLTLQGTATDWQYPTIPNNQSCLAFRGKQCRFSRGKCLGGTTGINFMFYTRSTPNDWDSLDIPGWTWDDIKPYFLRYEGLKDLNFLPDSSIPYHNTHGPMKFEFFEESNNPWHSRVLEGFLLLNVPYNPDVNAISQIGVTQILGYVYNGERMSTARGYLSRNDVKKALKVAKHTRCTKVIIDKNHVAKGVSVVSGNTPLNLYATREVILSAGAIATPQILMLSGIGHTEHLNSLNIPVHVDLPVGDKLTDHVVPYLFIKVDSNDRVVKTLSSVASAVDSLSQFLEAKEGPLASIGLADVNAFFNTTCYDYDRRQLMNHSRDCQLPTTQFAHGFYSKGAITMVPSIFQQITNLNDEVIKQLVGVNANHDLILLLPVNLQPESLGQIRLASKNPLDSPAIFPNLLTDERDIEEMLRAIRIVEDLIETRPYKKHKASLVKLEFKDCPRYEEDVEEYWRCYVRHMTQTLFHSVGTTGIGRVVDEKLRVFGIEGLRVADLGVVPRLVRANTAASAIAVGERVVDFLLEDRDAYRPKQKEDRY